MKREELVATLRQIEKLVADCLKAVGEKAAPSRKHHSRDKAVANSLPARIVELRDSGFFSQPKTARDVHTKLATTYPCEVNRVAMALPRLKKAKKLRKASKMVEDKKQDAYVW